MGVFRRDSPNFDMIESSKSRQDSTWDMYEDDSPAVAGMPHIEPLQEVHTKA